MTGPDAMGALAPAGAAGQGSSNGQISFNWCKIDQLACQNRVRRSAPTFPSALPCPGLCFLVLEGSKSSCLLWCGLWRQGVQDALAAALGYIRKVGECPRLWVPRFEPFMQLHASPGHTILSNCTPWKFAARMQRREFCCTQSCQRTQGGFWSRSIQLPILVSMRGINASNAYA